MSIFELWIESAVYWRFWREQAAQRVASARRVCTRGNACRLGTCLAKLGEARTGQGRFPEAESTLLEACGLLAAGFGENHERTVKCVQLLVALYDAWHAAEPTAGHDAQAAAWRAKLPEAETSSE